VAAGARGLVLSRPGWHPGVVGIVAARVVERFHRPAVLVGVAGGVGKGSGRSISAFHLHDALACCAGHLQKFGGHRHAAGVTLAPEAIPAFRDAFERHAASVLAADDLVPRTRIDGWVDAASLDDRAATDLEKLAPFGAGNPEPVFGVRVRPSRARQVGAAGVHLKLVLADRDAIAFQMGDRLPLCAGTVEAAVSLGFDDWDGMRRLQLRVRDLRGTDA
jgi:single-stranded-DNA-specific exonuclease